jgi:SAM-dependent methyltransferase
LWEVEKILLASLITEFRQSVNGRQIDYLDFASGTGRIIAYIEDKVDNATGIEISPAMCTIARKKLKYGKLLCCDITSPSTPTEGKYDLITAFRFILNAGPELRLVAMKALTLRLKDERSWIIFNNHANPFSIKLIMWPVHFIRQLWKGKDPAGNYLTNTQVYRLTTETDLHIVRVIGYGFLGGHLAKVFSKKWICYIESWLAKCPLLSRFGINQCYVAMLDTRKAKLRP